MSEAQIRPAATLTNTVFQMTANRGFPFPVMELRSGRLWNADCCLMYFHEMTRYLISFPSGAMDHIPHEEFPAVEKAAHAVVQEAMDAGVWVFGGGLAEDVDPVMVAGDGTITTGTYPQTREFNGGFTVLDLPSREEAQEWAAKIATACRCAQEVREFMPDPAVSN